MSFQEQVRIAQAIIAAWPEECSDSEWLSTYYSESLSNHQRQMFVDFDQFERGISDELQYQSDLASQKIDPPGRNSY